MSQPSDASGNSELVCLVQRCLHDGDADRLDACLGEVDDAALAADAWDLSAAMADYLTQENLERRPLLFVRCSATIRDRLAASGNAKEVFLVLLEALDRFKDDCRYEQLLPSVLLCLRRIGLASAANVDNALEVLYAHLLQCGLPDGVGSLEGDEFALLQNDARVGRAVRLAELFLSLLADLANDSGLGAKTKAVVARYAGLLLQHPLLPADICWRCGSAASDAFDCAARATRLLSDILGNSFADSLLQSEAVAASTPLPREARVAALVATLGPIGGSGCSVNLPQVYSGQHLLLHRLAPLLSECLAAQEVMLCRAALHVIARLLSSAQFDGGEWDLQQFKDFWRSLLFALIHSGAAGNRRLALDCVQRYYAACAPAGRYLAILHNLHTAEHPSCRGFFVSRLKEEIAVALDDYDRDGDDCKSARAALFTGNSVQRLLSKAFSLPKGAVSDMLEDSEVILPSLNLAKFLGVRDRQDRTLFWQHYRGLADTYLDEMRTGFNMSLAHYKAEYKNPTTEEDLIVPAEEMRADGVDPTISVGGVPLPPMSKGEKRRVMRDALSRLQLMQFVHGDACDTLQRHKPSWLADTADADGDNPYIRDATEVTHIPDDNWDPSDLTL